METLSPSEPIDPRRYFEAVAPQRSARQEREPVCLYLEVTNRCNLLCTTCPRTYVELEPPADMSFELFTSIVDQVPGLQRAVLHGVGEPMLVKELPRMVRYLKDRGVYVLFNTNGTLLTERNGRALIEAGLDELRVSLDASNPSSYLAVRGKNYFARILHNVRRFRELQEREGHALPKVSAWLTGSEGDDRRAARLRARRRRHRRQGGLPAAPGLLRGRGDRPRQPGPGALRAARFRRGQAHRRGRSDREVTRPHILASGAASEPGMSLKREDSASPWSLCRRPWSLMYFTANGRALPCCIAPFSQRGYEHYTLGDATQTSLRDIWNGPAYEDFRAALLSDAPAEGLRQLRPALEPVMEAVRDPSPACGRRRPDEIGGLDEGRRAFARDDGRFSSSCNARPRFAAPPSPASGRRTAPPSSSRSRPGTRAESIGPLLREIACRRHDRRHRRRRRLDRRHAGDRPHRRRLGARCRPRLRPRLPARRRGRTRRCHRRDDGWRRRR